MRLKIRRYWWLLVLLSVIMAGLFLGLGDERIIAYTTASSPSNSDAPATSTSEFFSGDISSRIALFDTSVVHSLQILIDEETYQQMISTYQQTGEKDYFHADVIIDGTLVQNVGVRLKGNASLRQAVGAMGNMRQGGRGFPMPGEDPELPQGGALPQGDNPEFPEGGAVPQPPEGGNFQRPEGGERPQPPADGNWQRPEGGNLPFGDAAGSDAATLAEASQDGEVKIPLLIKFDKFVDGQTYQGYSKLAVRTYGISSNAAMLNEPITNAVYQWMGLPVAETAYAGVQLNNGVEQLYTISEVLDDPAYLEENFSNSDGILYKSELGADLTYRSEDPASYAGIFTQESRINDADLAQLIDFIAFLNESDDTAFDNNLADWLDVDAFATYLAINNVLVNSDSMAGMSNNYYLYYDDSVNRFTILYWDGNESLGKLTQVGQAANFDIYFQNIGMPQGGNNRGGMNRSNTLVTRFIASDQFLDLYKQKLQQVYEQAFASGAIYTQIDQYTSLIRTASVERPTLVNLTSYESDAAGVLDFISQRQAYLEEVLDLCE